MDRDAAGGGARHRKHARRDFHVVAIHEDRDADLGEDEAGGAGEIQDGADNRVQLLGTAVERVEGCGGIGRLADGEGARRAKRMAAREQAARGD